MIGMPRRNMKMVSWYINGTASTAHFNDFYMPIYTWHSEYSSFQ